MKINRQYHVQRRGILQIQRNVEHPRQTVHVAGIVEVPDKIHSRLKNNAKNAKDIFMPDIQH